MSQGLAEVASQLAWLSPCAASLVALARAPTAAVWDEVRFDPGCVLLLLRHADPANTAPGGGFLSLLQNPAPLDAAVRHLEQRDPAFLSWDERPFHSVRDTSLTCAHFARLLAQRSGRSDPDSAWVAGLLAPLGWLAACALGHVSPQATACELDGSAVARRLNSEWRLPRWLAAITGHLALPAELAVSLGANLELFRVTQLAVSLAHERGLGLNLAVGGQPRELAETLDLTPSEIQGVKESAVSPHPQAAWEPPATVPLLPDLLRLAAENHRLHAAPSPEALQRDVDALHEALVAQRAAESERLQRLKLAALAELAAGAGHEINNPLAVISGQAQYLLKKVSSGQWTVDGQSPSASEGVALSLAGARALTTDSRQLTTALEKIISQVNRIHQTLTELMKFARPPAPKKRPLPAEELMREASAALHELAEERRVRLILSEPVAPLTLYADGEQAGIALRCLLRNAIEAAPAEGWASVRAEADAVDAVAFIVEDSGPGPSAADREHLFDPFYSGRKAGRGCGLGLPTAWRLAREHGGDVRHEDNPHGPTRFILRLPRAPGTNGTNGCHLPVERMKEEG